MYVSTIYISLISKTLTKKSSKADIIYGYFKRKYILLFKNIGMGINNQKML